MLATNYIEKIERALIRKGRIDHAFAVVYPDDESRRAMLCRHLQKHERRTDDINDIIKSFASNTRGWPWMTVEAACKETLGRLKPKEESKPAECADSASKAIEDNRTQFSRPQFVERLDADQQQKSPELLTEYLRHIISCCKGDEDLWKEKGSFETLETKWSLSYDDQDQELGKILKKDGRSLRLSICQALRNKQPRATSGETRGEEESPPVTLEVQELVGGATDGRPNGAEPKQQKGAKGGSSPPKRKKKSRKKTRG